MLEIDHDLLWQAARSQGVDCLVAPYEADAQLAYLNKAGIVQAIITEDSDLLAFGCKKVLNYDYYMLLFCAVSSGVKQGAKIFPLQESLFYLILQLIPAYNANNYLKWKEGLCCLTILNTFSD